MKKKVSVRAYSRRQGKLPPRNGSGKFTRKGRKSKKSGKQTRLF